MAPGPSPGDRVSAYLEAAVSGNVFPGCVLAHGSPARGEVGFLWAGHRGLSRNRVLVGPDLVYDLASMTKVLSTAFLLAIAVGEGLIGLGTEIRCLNWPVPDEIKGLRVEDLLTHQSGLPRWRPYYLDKGLANRDRLIETILREPKESKLGHETLYSDLNFILLGFVLETIYGSDLKTLFAERIARPLGLRFTGFGPNPLECPVAPTEDGPRLGGPLDWPGVKVLGPVPLGRVHDDNAAFLSGQAGHAGLFGPAGEIWRIVADWAKSLTGAPGALAPGPTMEAFLRPRSPKKGPPRAAGFDIGLGPL
ncbi:MAG: serine hydrolase, partial [Deltaproteobacteria bacterium]|nr:serine hydrolase [Deltaproteobacteria bacterium]